MANTSDSRSTDDWDKPWAPVDDKVLAKSGTPAERFYVSWVKWAVGSNEGTAKAHLRLRRSEWQQLEKQLPGMPKNKRDMVRRKIARLRVSVVAIEDVLRGKVEQVGETSEEEGGGRGTSTGQAIAEAFTFAVVT